ncbi:MAG: glutamyl-tRNA reductase [Lysobacterales bacterium]|jgi:glutamyl-tRNA reductase
MPLLATGISHHTAPLETREKIAIARKEYADHVKALCGTGRIEEVVLVSTCNRTEIYSVGPNESRAQVIQWLQAKGQLSHDEIQAHCYVREREKAVRHLFRVAGGLDSLVLGESQILGQLKEAWQMAHDAGGVGKVLDRLFQHAFATGKKIRSKTRIGEHPVSVAYTTVMLAKHIFGDLASKTVILVGAGEMVELCGRHLHEKGVTSLVIANRSIERARQLASQYDATAVTLADLPGVLHRADILISSTASAEPVLHPDAVKAALKQRRHRPMFLVDIAVPRDIHPDVGKLDDVYLYTIDDLQKVVDENISRRNEAAEAAGEDVARAVDEYMRWLNSARASVYLQKLHKHARTNSEELVAKAMRRLEAGKDPEKVVTQLANQLSKRILHLPSTRLRQAAENQDDELLRIANRLFEPEDEQ